MTDPPPSPSSTQEVKNLIEQLHTNIDEIHTTLHSLNERTSTHDKELEKLASAREEKLRLLSTEHENTLKSLLAEREKEEEEVKRQREEKERQIEEERKREWEEILARRKSEDEERKSAVAKEEEERRKVKEEEDAKREKEREEKEREAREEVEGEMERLEDEVERVVREGRTKVQSLDAARKDINQRIDAILNAPHVIPEITFRSRAKRLSRGLEGELGMNGVHGDGNKAGQGLKDVEGVKEGDRDGSKEVNGNGNTNGDPESFLGERGEKELKDKAEATIEETSSPEVNNTVMVEDGTKDISPEQAENISEPKATPTQDAPLETTHSESNFVTNDHSSLPEPVPETSGDVKEENPRQESHIQPLPPATKAEDPEDIKAREEIARMNAEFFAAAKAEEEEEERARIAAEGNQEVRENPESSNEHSEPVDDAKRENSEEKTEGEEWGESIAGNKDLEKGVEDGESKGEIERPNAEAGSIHEHEAESSSDHQEPALRGVEDSTRELEPESIPDVHNEEHNFVEHESNPKVDNQQEPEHDDLNSKVAEPYEDPEDIKAREEIARLNEEARLAYEAEQKDHESGHSPTETGVSKEIENEGGNGNEGGDAGERDVEPEKEVEGYGKGVVGHEAGSHELEMSEKGIEDVDADEQGPVPESEHTTHVSPEAETLTRQDEDASKDTPTPETEAEGVDHTTHTPNTQLEHSETPISTAANPHNPDSKHEHESLPAGPGSHQDPNNESKEVDEATEHSANEHSHLSPESSREISDESPPTPANPTQEISDENTHPSTELAENSQDQSLSEVTPETSMQKEDEMPPPTRPDEERGEQEHDVGSEHSDHNSEPMSFVEGVGAIHSVDHHTSNEPGATPNSVPAEELEEKHEGFVDGLDSSSRLGESEGGVVEEAEDGPAVERGENMTLESEGGEARKEDGGLGDESHEHGHSAELELPVVVNRSIDGLEVSSYEHHANEESEAVPKDLDSHDESHVELNNIPEPEGKHSSEHEDTDDTHFPEDQTNTIEDDHETPRDLNLKGGEGKVSGLMNGERYDEPESHRQESGGNQDAEPRAEDHGQTINTTENEHEKEPESTPEAHNHITETSSNPPQTPTEPTPEVIHADAAILETKPTPKKDPEDIKAREEIAKLNAELLSAAMAEQAEREEELKGQGEVKGEKGMEKTVGDVGENEEEVGGRGGVEGGHVHNDYGMEAGHKLEAGGSVEKGLGVENKPHQDAERDVSHEETASAAKPENGHEDLDNSDAVAVEHTASEPSEHEPVAEKEIHNASPDSQAEKLEDAHHDPITEAETHHSSHDAEISPKIESEDLKHANEQETSSNASEQMKEGADLEQESKEDHDLERGSETAIHESNIEPESSFQSEHHDPTDQQAPEEHVTPNGNQEVETKHVPDEGTMVEEMHDLHDTETHTDLPEVIERNDHSKEEPVENSREVDDMSLDHTGHVKEDVESAPTADIDTVHEPVAEANNELHGSGETAPSEETREVLDEHVPTVEAKDDVQNSEETSHIADTHGVDEHDTVKEQDSVIDHAPEGTTPNDPGEETSTPEHIPQSEDPSHPEPANINTSHHPDPTTPQNHRAKEEPTSQKAEDLLVENAAKFPLPDAEKEEGITLENNHLSEHYTDAESKDLDNVHGEMQITTSEAHLASDETTGVEEVNNGSGTSHEEPALGESEGIAKTPVAEDSLPPVAAVNSSEEISDENKTLPMDETKRDLESDEVDDSEHELSENPKSMPVVSEGQWMMSGRPPSRLGNYDSDEKGLAYDALSEDPILEEDASDEHHDQEKEDMHDKNDDMKEKFLDPEHEEESPPGAGITTLDEHPVNDENDHVGKSEDAHSHGEDLALDRPFHENASSQPEAHEMNTVHPHEDAENPGPHTSAEILRSTSHEGESHEAIAMEKPTVEESDGHGTPAVEAELSLAKNTPLSDENPTTLTPPEEEAFSQPALTEEEQPLTNEFESPSLLRDDPVAADNDETTPELPVVDSQASNAEETENKADAHVPNELSPTTSEEQEFVTPATGLGNPFESSDEVTEDTSDDPIGTNHEQTDDSRHSEADMDESDVKDLPTPDANDAHAESSVWDQYPQTNQSTSPWDVLDQETPADEYQDAMMAPISDLTPIMEEPDHKLGSQASHDHMQPIHEDDFDDRPDTPPEEIQQTASQLFHVPMTPPGGSQLRPRTPEHHGVNQRDFAESPATVLGADNLFDDDDSDDGEVQTNNHEEVQTPPIPDYASNRSPHLQELSPSRSHAREPLPQRPANHRNSGMFASLVDSIKHDVPLMRQVLGDPQGYAAVNDNEDNYSVSDYSRETPGETPGSRNAPGAFEDWERSVRRTQIPALDTSDASLHVRSHTADTVPSFGSYARSERDSAPSTPSEAASSPFMEAPLQEPAIQSWTDTQEEDNEPAEDDHQNLKPQASPMQADFDPYNNQNYAQNFSPTPTRTTFHIEPQKSIPNSPRENITLPPTLKTQGATSPTSFMKSRALNNNNSTFISPLTLSSTTTLPSPPLPSPTNTVLSPTERSRSISSPLPSPTYLPSRPTSTLITNPDRLSTLTNFSRTPVQSPSIPSTSIFQKTRSLFESNSTTQPALPATTRPLSGIFHVGRAKPAPPPVPAKRSSVISLGSRGSRPSSLHQSEVYQDENGSELQEIIPRSLDGNNKPPSPVFDHRSRSGSQASRNSAGSGSRNSIGSLGEAGGVRSKSSNPFLGGLGLGSFGRGGRGVEKGEKGLEDSVYNPRRQVREDSPLLGGEEEGRGGN